MAGRFGYLIGSSSYCRDTGCHEASAFLDVQTKMIQFRVELATRYGLS